MDKSDSKKSKSPQFSEEFHSNPEENRYKKITSRVVSFIEDLKSDDIYNAMKDSEYSKEYAVQRIRELFEESMNSEKEYYIDQLESEKNELITHFEAEKMNLDENLKNLQKENENLSKEIRSLSEKNSLNCKVIENHTKTEKELIEKLNLLSMTSTQKYDEELEFSKSQTLKLKKELDEAKKEKDYILLKDFEYKKDYDDFLSHIKILQNDKECLQNEIQEINELNFQLKESKCYLQSENDVLKEKIRELQRIVDEEYKNNRKELDQILSNFREKSKKFKSKILEQKKRLEDSAEEKKELLQNLENLKTLYENSVKNLEDKAANETIYKKEQEIHISKLQLENVVNIENLKKHFESLMNTKISEMQKEVDGQVFKCQNYEKNLKNVMDNKLNTLEAKNKELGNSNEELMKQLSSALEGLEKLRTGYSEQLSFSQNNEKETLSLKNLLQETQYQLKTLEKKYAEAMNNLALEEERSMQEHRTRINLEQELRSFEENAWKLKEELEITKNKNQKLVFNYENAIIDYKNNLHSENSKFSETLDRFRNLENYSKTLENQIQTINSETLKISKKNLKSYKSKNSYKSLKNTIQFIRQKNFDFKNFLFENFLSLQSFVKEIIEKLSYKILEKSAENRKLISKLCLVQKENSNLTTSIAVCSKEFDELSKELSEKQMLLREHSKSIREQAKEKYKEKFLKLERKLELLEKEKNLADFESQKTINLLREEIKYFDQKSGNYNNSNKNLKKDNTKPVIETRIYEQRINELESFLEAERLQKSQLLFLKNKEIEDLKLKFLPFKPDSSYNLSENKKFF